MNEQIRDAIIGNDLAKVQEIINSGFDVNSRINLGGDTPLILAINFNRPAIVDILINAGADVNLNSLLYGSTPIGIAIAFEHKNIFDKLINAGAKIDMIDSYGNTYLINALILYHRNSELYKYIVIELIKAGSNVNHRNYMGSFPLYIALDTNNTFCVEFLLNNGADIYMEYDHETIIERARHHDFSEHLNRLIINHDMWLKRRSATVRFNYAGSGHNVAGIYEPSNGVSESKFEGNIRGTGGRRRRKKQRKTHKKHK